MSLDAEQRRRVLEADTVFRQRYPDWPTMGDRTPHEAKVIREQYRAMIREAMAPRERQAPSTDRNHRFPLTQAEIEHVDTLIQTTQLVPPPAVYVLQGEAEQVRKELTEDFAQKQRELKEWFEESQRQLAEAQKSQMEALDKKVVSETETLHRQDAQTKQELEEKLQRELQNLPRPEVRMDAANGMSKEKVAALVDEEVTKRQKMLQRQGSASFAMPAMAVSDNAYGTTWNGDASTAPSKNAVYDILAVLQSLLAHTSTYPAWMPCPYEGSTVIAQDLCKVDGSHGGISAASSYVYSVPLSTTRNGLKLYITGTNVLLSDADASDYITNTYLQGLTSLGAWTAADTDPTDKTAVGSNLDSFTTVDCSTYLCMKVVITAIWATANDLDIGTVLVQYYYGA